MKIGIIVHSHTGNTYSVAEKIKEELLVAGHSVSLEKVVAVNDSQAEAAKVELETNPEVGPYDALIFGAPVRGFSISPVLAAYLSKVASLQGKKVSCFVTQHLPYPWLGGNRAIGQMKKICESKGAQVFGSGIVNWSSKHRQKKMDDVVGKLKGLHS